jgi:hypothetical protein
MCVDQVPGNLAASRICANKVRWTFASENPQASRNLLLCYHDDATLRTRAACTLPGRTDWNTAPRSRAPLQPVRQGKLQLVSLPVPAFSDIRSRITRLFWKKRAVRLSPNCAPGRYYCRCSSSSASRQYYCRCSSSSASLMKRAGTARMTPPPSCVTNAMLTTWPSTFTPGVPESAL